ncbi:uncharacterized protein [Henckelia pumila]|uniref:uncharacterized protein n=1 Tax=Henckelia pumila TaxID=405737 RepID=UPI003C6DC4BD
MRVKKSVVFYAVEPLTSISAQLSALTTQVAALHKVSIADSAGVSVAIEESHPLEEAQYINPRDYGGYRGNPIPNTYHPGLCNHENFSYANNKNVLNPPPGFNMNKGEGKPLLEDVVSTFVTEFGKMMAITESRLDSLETHVVNMDSMMKSMETQIGKLAIALKDNNRGHFPSNTEVNPIEQCKVIELWSGKRIGAEGSKSERKRSEGIKISVEEQKVENSAENKIEKKFEEKKIEPEPKPMYKPQLLYPQRFSKKALDEQFTKFLEIFKKIYINIPFADGLDQMPNYAKFIKEVMSKKRRLRENEVVNLTKECNVVLQKKMPQKALELGEMKSTTITLNLAYRSITYPRGIVEDVLVKVDKFIFPIDFVILDIEEDHDGPFIFGRPFLATADVIKNGELTLDVEGEKLIVHIFEKANNSSMEELFMIERFEKLECRHKAVREVESPKEKEPSVPKKKNKPKKEKFKKQFVEYILRVKEKWKTLNKKTTV